MAAFQEPEVLATFDRSYDDKKDRLQLEKGEFKGRSTFTLRAVWLAQDGRWRWTAQKPSSSGKCWERLNIKGRELFELGEALIQAAKDAGIERVEPAPRQQVRDTPGRKAAREKFDRENPTYRGPGHGPGMPF